MALLNLGGTIAQFQRNDCSISPVEVIWRGGVRNNRAERSIKPFVIDRKNFLFANTPNGAKGSATIFSFIQTAIENSLDPYRYLTWLLKAANNADLADPE